MRVGQRPVHQRVQQREQQRAVGPDLDRLQRLAHLHAARLGLAAALGQHAAQHLREVLALAAQVQPAGGQAGELLAQHASSAGIVHAAAQQAQAAAVDLAGGGEVLDLLQRRAQRPGDLGAKLLDDIRPLDR